MSVALIAPGAGLSWPGAGRAGKGGDAGRAVRGAVAERAGSGNDEIHGGNAVTGPVASNGSGSGKGRDGGNDAAMAKGGTTLMAAHGLGLPGPLEGQSYVARA